ncbi:MAG: hypothetical protein RJA59_374 [Pseudomonadota bacterium]|jgi:hypothetical protein
MSLQMSGTVRDARLDAIETAIGTAPLLRIYDLSGAAPANCAAAITATLLAEMTLPSDWLAAASGGTKAKAGTWEDASANGTGTADFWRIYDASGTTCHLQGTVTLTGGGGDLTLVNTSLVATQGPITITGFTLTEGNA